VVPTFHTACMEAYAFAASTTSGWRAYFSRSDRGVYYGRIETPSELVWECPAELRDHPLVVRARSDPSWTPPPLPLGTGSQYCIQSTDLGSASAVHETRNFDDANRHHDNRSGDVVEGHVAVLVDHESDQRLEQQQQGRQHQNEHHFQQHQHQHQHQQQQQEQQQHQEKQQLQQQVAVLTVTPTSPASETYLADRCQIQSILQSHNGEGHNFPEGFEGMAMPMMVSASNGTSGMLSLNVATSIFPISPPSHLSATTNLSVNTHAVMDTGSASALDVGASTGTNTSMAMAMAMAMTTPTPTATATPIPSQTLNRSLTPTSSTTASATSPAQAYTPSSATTSLPSAMATASNTVATTAETTVCGAVSSTTGPVIIPSNEAPNVASGSCASTMVSLRTELENQGSTRASSPTPAPTSASITTSAPTRVSTPTTVMNGNNNQLVSPSQYPPSQSPSSGTRQSQNGAVPQLQGPASILGTSVAAPLGPPIRSASSPSPSQSPSSTQTPTAFAQSVPLNVRRVAEFATEIDRLPAQRVNPPIPPNVFRDGTIAVDPTENQQQRQREQPDLAAYATLQQHSHVPIQQPHPQQPMQQMQQMSAVVVPDSYGGQAVTDPAMLGLANLYALGMPTVGGVLPAMGTGPVGLTMPGSSSLMAIPACPVVPLGMTLPPAQPNVLLPTTSVVPNVPAGIAMPMSGGIAVSTSEMQSAQSRPTRGQSPKISSTESSISTGSTATRSSSGSLAHPNLRKQRNSSETASTPPTREGMSRTSKPPVPPTASYTSSSEFAGLNSVTHSKARSLTQDAAGGPDRLILHAAQRAAETLRGCTSPTCIPICLIDQWNMVWDPRSSRVFYVPAGANGIASERDLHLPSEGTSTDPTGATWVPPGPLLGVALQIETRFREFLHVQLAMPPNADALNLRTWNNFGTTVQGPIMVSSPTLASHQSGSSSSLSQASTETHPASDSKLSSGSVRSAAVTSNHLTHATSITASGGSQSSSAVTTPQAVLVPQSISFQHPQQLDLQQMQLELQVQLQQQQEQLLQQLNMQLNPNQILGTTVGSQLGLSRTPSMHSSQPDSTYYQAAVAAPGSTVAQPLTGAPGDPSTQLLLQLIQQYQMQLQHQIHQLQAQQQFGIVAGNPSYGLPVQMPSGLTSTSANLPNEHGQMMPALASSAPGQLPVHPGPLLTNVPYPSADAFVAGSQLAQNATHLPVPLQQQTLQSIAPNVQPVASPGPALTDEPSGPSPMPSPMPSSTTVTRKTTDLKEKSPHKANALNGGEADGTERESNEAGLELRVQGFISFAEQLCEDTRRSIATRAGVGNGDMLLSEVEHFQRLRPVECEGYVVKRGNGIWNRWKPRWMRLKDGKLAYWATYDDACKDRPPIREATVVGCSFYTFLPDDVVPPKDIKALLAKLHRQSPSIRMSGSEVDKASLAHVKQLMSIAKAAAQRADEADEAAKAAESRLSEIMELYKASGVGNLGDGEESKGIPNHHDLSNSAGQYQMHRKGQTSTSKLPSGVGLANDLVIRYVTLVEKAKMIARVAALEAVSAQEKLQRAAAAHKISLESENVDPDLDGTVGTPPTSSSPSFIYLLVSDGPKRISTPFAIGFDDENERDHWTEVLQRNGAINSSVALSRAAYFRIDSGDHAPPATLFGDRIEVRTDRGITILPLTPNSTITPRGTFSLKLTVSECPERRVSSAYYIFRLQTQEATLRWYKLIREILNSQQGNLFGSTIDWATVRSPVCIPLPIRDCSAWLLTNGKGVADLWMMPSQPEQAALLNESVRIVVDAYNSSKFSVIPKLLTSAHTVAHVLTKYIEALPDALFPSHFWEQLLELKLENISAERLLQISFLQRQRLRRARNAHKLREYAPSSLGATVADPTIFLPARAAETKLIHSLRKLVLRLDDNHGLALSQFIYTLKELYAHWHDKDARRYRVEYNERRTARRVRRLTRYLKSHPDLLGNESDFSNPASATVTVKVSYQRPNESSRNANTSVHSTSFIESKAKELVMKAEKRERRRRHEVRLERRRKLAQKALRAERRMMAEAQSEAEEYSKSSTRGLIREDQGDGDDEPQHDPESDVSSIGSSVWDNSDFDEDDDELQLSTEIGSRASEDEHDSDDELLDPRLFVPISRHGSTRRLFKKAELDLESSDDEMDDEYDEKDDAFLQTLDANFRPGDGEDSDEENEADHYAQAFKDSRRELQNMVINFSGCLVREPLTMESPYAGPAPAPDPIRTARLDAILRTLILQYDVIFPLGPPFPF